MKKNIVFFVRAMYLGNLTFFRNSAQPPPGDAAENTKNNVRLCLPVQYRIQNLGKFFDGDDHLRINGFGRNAQYFCRFFIGQTFFFD